MCVQRTNSPHIDVTHVALAKIGPNYIAVSCGCVLCKLKSSMSHISSRITDMKENISIISKMMLYWP